MENQYMIHIASVPVSVQKEKWSSTVIVYIVNYFWLYKHSFKPDR